MLGIQFWHINFGGDPNLQAIALILSLILSYCYIFYLDELSLGSTAQCVHCIPAPIITCCNWYFWCFFLWNCELLELRNHVLTIFMYLTYEQNGLVSILKGQIFIRETHSILKLKVIISLICVTVKLWYILKNSLVLNLQRQWSNYSTKTYFILWMNIHKIGKTIG